MGKGYQEESKGVDFFAAGATCKPDPDAFGFFLHEGGQDAVTDKEPQCAVTEKAADGHRHESFKMGEAFLVGLKD